MTAADAAGSQAKTWPRCSTFGQEMLTSMAVPPAASDSRAARSAYSATVPPAMETTARAPRDSSQGRSRCRNESMPGPCRPIELSMPLGVSAIRGVGRPARGPSMTDLVGIAPILDTSMNWASSRPELAQPEAVRMGLGSSTWPSRARRSVMAPPSRLARRAGGAERDGADVVPADLLAAEARPVHARPHHPGDPVAAGHRQHAGHADADPAGHGLLHAGLDRDVVPPGQRGDLAQHRHRPAGVDDVGAGLVDDLPEPVRD